MVVKPMHMHATGKAMKMSEISWACSAPEQSQLTGWRSVWLRLLLLAMLWFLLVSAQLEMISCSF